jgi:hypothetical protein
MIKISGVGTAHSLLVTFCCNVEKLYGTQQITPNMHMHTHLVDCVLDYGPVYSFTFEQYNGILGNYSTNNKSIEFQIMRKFLRDQNLRKFEFPEECAQHFRYLTEKLHHHKGYQTENCPLDGKQCIDILQICNGRIDIQSALWFSLAGYSLGSPQVIEQLDNDEHQYQPRSQGICSWERYTLVWSGHVTRGFCVKWRLVY